MTARWLNVRACALIAAMSGLPMAAAAQTAPAPASAQPNAAPAATQASPAPAAGSGATTQPAGTQSTTVVGEIVVQAERRSELLRDVPAAVTATSGANLAAIGPVVNTSDLINAVPGAHFNNLGDPLNSEIQIRGSGTERATGADTSVGLYFNGVYVGSSSPGGRVFAPIDNFDLDHLEVLEGPQGALYGRDAEYGIINLIPQEPTFTNSGYVDELYNFQIEQNQETAVVNYRINDNWAIRLGAQGIEQGSGFEYNPDQDNYYDTTRGYIVRGQVRYRNERLDVDLLAERQQMQIPSFWSADEIAPKNTTTGYPGYATLPLGFNQNPRDIAHNGIDSSKEDVDNVMLSVKYKFDFATLQSTTSWRRVDTIDDIDSDYFDLPQEIAVQARSEKGIYPFAQTLAGDVTNTYYEDLHLNGTPIIDNRITWLGGIELLYQTDDSSSTVTANPCATRTNPNPIVGAGFCTGTPTDEICVTGLPGSNCNKEAYVNPFGSATNGMTDYFSWAPYASTNIKLGYGFNLEGAVRYSHDHKFFEQDVAQLYTGLPYTYLTNGQVVPPSDDAFSKGQFTYAVTLDYKLPGPFDDMIYTKVGTGYRVGGFNSGHSPPLLTGPLPAGLTNNVFYAPVQPIYSDETSFSYEIGFKGDFTRHIYFTLDAYREITNNALAAVGDGCLATNRCESANTNYTVNAGKVDGSGAEASINTAWDLAGGHMTLQLDGSTQYASVKSEPLVEPDGEPAVGLPVVGTPISENPRWLANATFTYRHPINDHTSAFFNALYHGQWGGIMDPVTTPGVYYPLSSYNEVNLRTGIDFNNLEAAVLVNNLTNDVYLLHVFGQAGTNTLTGIPEFVETQERLSLPRSVSIELTYKW